MNFSLLDLVNNLSQIYKKKTKKYKGCEERRKIKSVCNFIWLKNNKLSYKCKECKKIWLKTINELRINQKCPNTQQFAMETLINLFCC